MEYIDKCHQYLIQFMLKNGVSKVQQALQYCRNVTKEEELSESKLGITINQINRVVCNQYFKIVQCKCEVTQEEMLVWVNMKNDTLTKLQVNFSERELEYFQAILQEIMASEQRKIMYIVCINITSTLSGNFSRESGQKVLTKWMHGGYFVKNSDFVHLGPRLILEFNTYLRSHRPDCVCYLCSEISFTGKICASCDKMFHSYCIDLYLQSQITCPCCKNDWTEIDRFNNIARDTTQGSNSDSDEYMQEEDINQPGPSRRRR
ncbi:non-structural maintenance of chromosomes element 1 homolog [Coccinella septempunctata]|uniref:non-structural maintenance of chromosomes element 1 homolog n=1 Tax=Coccinella septempunctata TaxID=41139 RepID=UPI001D06CABB|nr:non-structural maintenance of chromosomes element 1 homolog [Coccinella septempunctata]